MKILLSILLFFSLQSHGQIINASSPYRVASAPASCAKLLDTYPGAAAAYSLRKLDCDYTGYAIKVRRSFDNAEQDIGFTDNGDLDTAAIRTFSTGSTGFVSVWYDQSGNSNNATQTTAASQPVIFASGVFFRDNTRPVVQVYNGPFLNLTTALASNSNFAIFGVQKRTATNVALTVLSNLTNDAPYAAMQFSDGNTYLTDGTNYVGGSDGLTTYQLLTSFRVSGTLSIYRNGASLSGASGAFSGASTFNTIGNRHGNPIFGNISEIIFYSSDQSSNRTGIESNINTYYTIY